MKTMIDAIKYLDELLVTDEIEKLVPNMTLFSSKKRKEVIDAIHEYAHEKGLKLGEDVNANKEQFSTLVFLAVTKAGFKDEYFKQVFHYGFLSGVNQAISAKVAQEEKKEKNKKKSK